MNDEICYYCGMPGNQIDHVIPRIILKSINETNVHIHDNRIEIVPCCHECNVLLGASFQSTLAERKHYLKVRLKYKYRSLLKIPEWIKAEIDVLGYTLKQDLLDTLNKKELLLLRLKW